MSTIVAHATRSGQWWAVEFDTPTGTFHTQARRLDQVPAMVRDILDMEHVGQVAIEVAAHVPDQDAVDEARQASADAAAAVEKAAARSRAAVARLRAEGLTVRDIGTLMNLSPQRVSQLAS